MHVARTCALFSTKSSIGSTSSMPLTSTSPVLVRALRASLVWSTMALVRLAAESFTEASLSCCARVRRRRHQPKSGVSHGPRQQQLQQQQKKKPVNRSSRPTKPTNRPVSCMSSSECSQYVHTITALSIL